MSTHVLYSYKCGNKSIYHKHQMGKKLSKINERMNKNMLTW